jgi:succinoglycan biosynthesis protein ExoM
MSSRKAHITVCVCTFRRKRFLERLLRELGRQATDGEFTYSIVVADNDYLESARPVVLDFAKVSSVPIKYCVEARQNIALARNKAIENTQGDYVAFCDDDEMPVEGWLRALLRTCERYEADGVLGSAEPEFEGNPPAWVVKGRFYARPTHETCFVIDWRKGRTGNLLLKRSLFSSGDQAFRPDFVTGEDQDFFRRMIEKGHFFVWCNEATTHEIIPAVRCRRSFLLRRALLRGKNSLFHPGSRLRELLKAAIAVLAYTAALPLLLLSGQHLFMKYLVKLFEHLGRLSVGLGMDWIGDKYVTD